jgi:hypothetical protein
MPRWNRTFHFQDRPGQNIPVEFEDAITLHQLWNRNFHAANFNWIVEAGKDWHILNTAVVFVTWFSLMAFSRFQNTQKGFTLLFFLRIKDVDQELLKFQFEVVITGYFHSNDLTMLMFYSLYL